MMILQYPGKMLGLASASDHPWKLSNRDIRLRGQEKCVFPFCSSRVLPGLFGARFPQVMSRVWVFLGPQDQGLEFQCPRKERWMQGKESRWSWLETSRIQWSHQERGISLPEGVVCQAYQGAFPEGEGLGVGKPPSVPQSLMTLPWTQGNHRVPFPMVDILFGFLENGNTSAVMLSIVPCDFAQTTITPSHLVSLSFLFTFPEGGMENFHPWLRPVPFQRFSSSCFSYSFSRGAVGGVLGNVSEHFFCCLCFFPSRVPLSFSFDDFFGGKASDFSHLGKS